MFDVFGGVKGLLKLSSIKIDNNVFRLHYKATVIILVTFSLLITSNQYIGDPIDCMADEIPADVMDTYCWIYSTFTVPDRLSGRVGKDMIHPGVAPLVDGENDVKFHKYYQWVCFVLIFQALLFYTPHYFWKMWEGERIKKLVADLTDPVENEKTSSKINTVVDYFQNNQAFHTYYTSKFVFCEFLNLVNVIGQIFFMDYFLDGEFSTYGWDVISFTDLDPEDRIDPMARVFPKITKCTFQKYGPSGTVQKFDGLCVLPLNIVNEKIYVFLWFWFVILSAVTGLALIYRLATYFVPYLRVRGLSIGGLADKKDIDYFVNHYENYGDWFVLQQLGENADPVIYKKIVNQMNPDNRKNQNQKKTT